MLGAWHIRASAPLARQEVSYVYAPRTGMFYLAGGRSKVQEAYDPRTDSWHTVAALPAALDHIQAVNLNGLVYYLGGLAGWPSPAVGTVYAYDPGSDVFSERSPMPTGRERGAGGVAVYHGKIYYAGGLHDGVAVPWFDEYDPVTDTWKRLPDLPEARDHFQGVVVGDRFYAIGGRNTSINATTTVNDAFDMTTASWVTGLAPLPTPRGGFAATNLGNKVLIIGGEGSGRTYATVEAYDPSTDRWTTLSSMPTARHGIEAAVCNGGVYIADGGSRQAGGAPTKAHEVFFWGAAKGCVSSAT